MKVLFTFYVPSGGVDTLNRLRTAVLKRHGIEAHLLYLSTGSGLQNNSDTPIFTASSDEDIHHIIHTHHYDAIIATSDIAMPGRLRGLGYTGRIIFEAQGLGARDQALKRYRWVSHTSKLIVMLPLYLPQTTCWICSFISVPGFIGLLFPTCWIRTPSHQSWWIPHPIRCWLG